ncbi:MAG: hypothetical protein JW969_12955 [Spirochaetales bacterium]|nr:hypothetical protein [Spirochaetales bacterium]
MKVSLGMKLFAGFAVIIVLVVGVILYNLFQLQNMNIIEDGSDRRSKQALGVTHALDIGPVFYEIVTDRMIHGESVTKEKVMAVWNEKKAESKEEIDYILSTVDTDKERSAANEVKTAFTSLVSLLEEEMIPATFASQGITPEILAMDVRMDGFIEKMQGPLEELVVDMDKEAEAAAREFDANYAATFMVSLIIGILAVLIGILISILLTRSISGPLMKISDTLTSSSGQIASASSQLSSSSQEIANGATEQASSIEETTSSMEELASMVKQNVSNAQEASTLADKASEASQTGYSQMETMLGSINEINKSSDEIRKVINVIDSLAFQTNMLALNAAVEAARAGEAGMGFAVVADEVKNLANRSAEAAKDTASMIEESIKRTEQGMEIATKLAETFKQILNNAKKVSEMSKEVETASRQQDSGINQVNKAIVQFDEVVQNNANSAEETASSAEEMTAQAENLKGIVETLTELVTGRANGHNGHNRQLTTGITIAGPSKTGTGKHILHATVGTVKRLKKKEISPEKLIPFEEDEDLRDE